MRIGLFKVVSLDSRVLAIQMDLWKDNVLYNRRKNLIELFFERYNNENHFKTFILLYLFVRIIV